MTGALPRADAFRWHGVPLMLIAALAAGSGLGVELALPVTGLAERRADAQWDLALGLRWGGAVAVSLAALWFVRGVLRDRQLLRGRDDRLAGSYLAAGLVGGVLCAAGGAPVGVIACAAGVLVIGRMRFIAPAVSHRVLRSAVMAGLGLALLARGVPESIRIWAFWCYGFEDASAAPRSELVDRLQVDLVQVVLVALVVLVSAGLGLLAWLRRHQGDGA